MKLATLQISLRIDLCHLAAAAMTVSALPGLFLFTVRTIAYLKDLTVFFYKVFFGLPLGLAPSTSQSMHLCVCDAGWVLCVCWWVHWCGVFWERRWTDLSRSRASQTFADTHWSLAGQLCLAAVHVRRILLAARRAKWSVVFQRDQQALAAAGRQWQLPAGTEVWHHINSVCTE